MKDIFCYDFLQVLVKQMWFTYLLINTVKATLLICQ